MTIQEAFRFGFSALSSYSDSYAIDTELILSKSLFFGRKPSESNFLAYVHSIDKTRLARLSPTHQLSKIQRNTFKKLISLRMRHIPIAHLTNVKEFYGLPFYVDNRVLIPRPQTELLVEKTLHEITKKRNHKNTTIIDIGTGSGCIIVSIAKALIGRDTVYGTPAFIAIDSDSRALAVAKRNARIHKVSPRVRFVKTDVLPSIKTRHLIIVANLPYLDPRLKSKLTQATPELQYEPQHALFSPNHGLKGYLNLIQQLKRNQKKHVGMTCFLEIDPHQRNILSKQINQTLRRKNSYYDGVIEFRFP